MEQSSFIKINPADSVVVCLRPMKKGETIEVDGKAITLLQDTPAGHKGAHQRCCRGYRYSEVWLPYRSCKDRSQGGRMGKREQPQD